MVPSESVQGTDNLLSVQDSDLFYLFGFCFIFKFFFQDIFFKKHWLCLKKLICFLVPFLPLLKTVEVRKPR